MGFRLFSFQVRPASVGLALSHDYLLAAADVDTGGKSLGTVSHADAVDVVDAVGSGGCLYGGDASQAVYLVFHLNFCVAVATVSGYIVGVTELSGDDAQHVIAKLCRYRLEGGGIGTILVGCEESVLDRKSVG